jgi:uracil-DNA glycosylase
MLSFSRAPSRTFANFAGQILDRRSRWCFNCKLSRVKLRTALCSMLAGWESDLPPRWRSVLGGTKLNWCSPALDYNVAPGEFILPSRKGKCLPNAREDAHVFRAFDNTSPDEVSAIVLGQDPYPNPVWATGRAFEQGDLSTWPEDPQQVAASLRRILLAIAAERTKDPSYTATDRAWKKLIADARHGLIPLEAPRELFDRLEREGVLFLNTSLTVSISGGISAARNVPKHGPKQCHRHFPLWAPLIHRVLTYIAARQSASAVFLLLGRHAEGIFAASGARAVAEGVGNWKTRVDTVCHFHPAAITAEGPVFLRPPNPFRAANDLLQRMGAPPVSW